MTDPVIDRIVKKMYKEEDMPEHNCLDSMLNGKKIRDTIHDLDAHAEALEAERDAAREDGERWRRLWIATAKGRAALTRKENDLTSSTIKTFTTEELRDELERRAWMGETCNEDEAPEAKPFVETEADRG